MEFMEFLEKTLREEGGWSNNPNDLGGMTQMGITRDTLGVWLGRRATEDEIRNLTRDQAIEIYRVMYYERPLINLLPDVIEPAVFDWGVNAGPGRAIKGLQQLCDNVGVAPHINVDGGIGKFTLEAVKMTLAALGDKTFINAYCDERQAFYNSIIARNPSQDMFRQGWTNRVNRFRVA